MEGFESIRSMQNLRLTNKDQEALVPERQQSSLIGDPNSISITWNSIAFNTNGRRLARYIDSKMGYFVSSGQ